MIECVSVTAAVFVDEFGDEKDVVGAGKDGERENGRVYRGQVPAGALGNAGGEHDDADRSDLNGRVDFTQHRGAKAAKTGDDVDGRCADEDKNVAANHRHRYPERHRQVRRQRLGKHRPHRQHYKRSDQHQLVGNRVEDRAELRFLIETPRQQAVETVSDAGQDKYRQGENEFLVEQKRDEDGDQNHPKHSQQVWDGNNPG